MILIKPHHFIDIIKLYGAGIEEFVPDEAFHHDFYKVANEVVRNSNCQLQFTIYGDDICKPCHRFKDSICIDPLNNIQGYNNKETYNQVLDTRLMEFLELTADDVYTVKQMIEKLSYQTDIIFHVWLEENDSHTEKRNDLFKKGLMKLKSKV